MAAKTLTESLVREIMRLHAEGLGSTRISREINRSYRSVYDVQRGKTWVHVTGGRLSYGRRPKYSDTVKRRAVELSKRGVSYCAIERKLGISDRTVSRWAKQCG